MLSESREGNKNDLSRLVLIIGFSACFSSQKKATKDYPVHKGLTTHDVEKHPVTKRYARVSFSSAKSGMSSGRYSFSSPTRVGLVDPPRTPRQSRSVRSPSMEVCRNSPDSLDHSPRSRRSILGVLTEREDSRSSWTCCRAPRPCRANCAPSSWCWSDCRGTF